MKYNFLKGARLVKQEGVFTCWDFSFDIFSVRFRSADERFCLHRQQLRLHRYIIADDEYAQCI